MTMRQRAAKFGLIVICAAGSMCAPLADAQVYRCTDGNGRTTYSDAACPSASQSRKLSNDAAPSRNGTTVCGQLSDERQRLAAEADREAKRGRKESGEHARKRQALAREYAARCVGIARSDARAK